MEENDDAESIKGAGCVRCWMRSREGGARGTLNDGRLWCGVRHRNDSAFHTDLSPREPR
jgi:hypothetical protein